MQTGLRLYQAIIDQSQDNGLEFSDAALACGFTSQLLLNCFENNAETTTPLLYTTLTRTRINKTARFLGASGFRVFLLADVLGWGDCRTILAQEAMISNPMDGVGFVSKYFNSLLNSTIFGTRQTIIDGLICESWSRNLYEACLKLGLDHEKIFGWGSGRLQAKLSDIDEIKTIAKILSVEPPVVMGSLGLLIRDDFEVDGMPISVESEISQFLEVEIW